MAATRTDRLHVRLTEEEREMFDAAAQADGETLSTWLRRAGREKILRAEGQRLGVLPKRRAK